MGIFEKFFGPPNIEKLKEKGDVKALSHPDYRVRRAAAGALGDVGDARAVEPLVAALKDENFFGESRTVRRDAADALGGRMIGVVRKSAEEALERIGGPEAERALAEYRAREK